MSKSLNLFFKFNASTNIDTWSAPGGLSACSCNAPQLVYNAEAFGFSAFCLLPSKTSGPDLAARTASTISRASRNRKGSQDVRRIVTTVVLLSLVACNRGSGGSEQYKTEKVTRGDITMTMIRCVNRIRLHRLLCCRAHSIHAAQDL